MKDWLGTPWRKVGEDITPYNSLLFCREIMSYPSAWVSKSDHRVSSRAEKQKKTAGEMVEPLALQISMSL